jgi:hypothetical protein
MKRLGLPKRRGSKVVTRGGWKELKQGTTHNGYKKVDIYNKKGPLTTRVHLLVLLVFVGPRPDNCQGRHNNGIRADNRLSNLRWDTAQADYLDKVRHGTATIGEKNPNAVLTNEDVYWIRSVYKKGSREFGCPGLANKLGVASFTVRKIILGQAWRHLLPPETEKKR